MIIIIIIKILKIIIKKQITATPSTQDTGYSRLHYLLEFMIIIRSFHIIITKKITPTQSTQATGHRRWRYLLDFMIIIRSFYIIIINKYHQRQVHRPQALALFVGFYDNY